MFQKPIVNRQSSIGFATCPAQLRRESKLSIVVPLCVLAPSVELNKAILGTPKDSFRQTHNPRTHLRVIVETWSPGDRSMQAPAGNVTPSIASKVSSEKQRG